MRVMMSSMQSQWNKALAAFSIAQVLGEASV